MWSLVITIIILATSASPAEKPSLTQGVFNLLWHGTQMSMAEPASTSSLRSEYDFIIVGAGTAGCVVANRLTEVKDWNVLLIEAGGAENVIMDIPVIANYFQFTDANWKYKTVPSDKACLGLVGRSCNWPRGKVMGGSSVLNYMIYTRGNRRDYDRWAEMGNEGWSYDQVLPYFMKSEDISIPELKNKGKHHKTGGYLTVSYPPYRTLLADAFIEAGLQSGQPYVDYDGETQTGFAYLHTTTRNGSRLSSSKAFLHPIKKRKNLHVKKNSFVTRIIVDATTKTATGVEFVSRGKKYVVRASKEVVLSGGTINSPQLLMLSGIGPKADLQRHGIPVVEDLPVGHNLMDHIAVPLMFVVNDTVSLRTSRVLDDGRALADYLMYHQGPLSVPGGCEALAFYDYEHPNDPDGHAEVEILFMGASLASDATYRSSFGITDEVYRKFLRPVEDSDTWMTLPMLLRPKSRGKIVLRDANPARKPLIYHNYFDDPYDLDTILKGVRTTIELSKTPAFQRYASKLHDAPVPGCEQHRFDSDAYWKCAIAHLTFTIYHYSGTCKMGNPRDPTAVVDPRLRVIGVKALRVIDASIIPEIPAAHTNGPVYMIAEKGSDMIKEDWKVLMRSR